MAFQSIISTVRSVTKQQVAAPAVPAAAEPKPQGRFIGASDYEKKPSTASTSRVSLSTSVTSIRDELAAKKSLIESASAGASWAACKCLKQLGSKQFCTKFLSSCAKENCPPKFIEN